MSAEQEDAKRLRVNANTRLFDALTNMATHPAKQHTANVLRLALGLKDNSHDLGYLKSFAVLYRMLEVAEREQAYYLQDDLGVFKPSLDMIRVVLNPINSAQHWEQRKPITWETTLTHIFHAGLSLQKLAPECELRTDELADILVSIDELRGLVESLVIPEFAKQKLRERCSQLKISVEEYRFWGVEGIELKFESAAIAMFALAEEKAVGKSTVPWKRIVEITLAISNILSIGRAGYEHAHRAYLLLSPIVSTLEQHSGKLIEAIENKL